MTDSPINSLASLHSFGSGSRPSTAYSDASFVTARPGSSASAANRSISHEIDHIKTLISRFQEAPAKPTGSISAQVFRQRSSSSASVTQAHIYHELDQLKRRIRQEQQQQHLHQLTRRISQIDPGQESESDHEEVPDEREVELERAREDVIVVRQRLDGLLERAELRIDRLSADKERLESAYEQSREGLESAVLERRSLAHTLEVAQTSIEHLTSRLSLAQKALQEHQSQLVDLQKRKLASDAAYESSQQEVALLQSHKTELETGLDAAKDESSKALEESRRLGRERDDARRRAEDHARTISQLHEEHREALEHAKSESGELLSQLEHKDGLLARQQRNHEEALHVINERMRELESDRKEKEYVSSERDKLLSRTRLEAEELAARIRNDGERQLQELRDAHAQELQRLASDCEDSVQKMRREQSERHEAAMEAARKEHSDEQLRLRNDHREELAQVEGKISKLDSDHEEIVAAIHQEHSKEKAKLSEQFSQGNADFKAELLKMQSGHEEILAAVQMEHSTERSKLLGSHREEVARLDAQIATLEVENQESLAVLRKEHDGTVAALSARHASENETLEKTLGTQIDELQAGHQAAIAAINDEHRNAIERIGTDHAQIVQAKDEQYNSLIATHESTLKVRQDQHEEEISQLNLKSSLELKSLTDKHERQFQETTSSCKAALQDAEERQKSLETSIMQLQSEHQHELADERERGERVISEHQSASESVAADNHLTTSRLQAELSSAQEALEVLKKHSTEESTRIELEHQRKAGMLEAECSQKVEDALSAHRADLQKAADEAARNADTATQRFKAELIERDSTMAYRIAEFQSAHAQEATCIRENAKTDVEAAYAELMETKQRLLAEHADNVAQLQSEHNKILEERQAKYQVEIDAVRAELEAKMEAVKDDHGRFTTELRSTHAEELQQLTNKHDQETNEMQMQSRAEMELLRKDSVEVLSRVNAIEADYDAQIEDLKAGNNDLKTQLEREILAHAETKRINTEQAIVLQREVEGLQARIEDIQFEADERAFATDKQHKATLEAAVERTRQIGQAELRNLKKRHQEAVSQVRATAQKQAAAQLTDLEKSHRQLLESTRCTAEESLASLAVSHRDELTKLRQSASESHQGDLMRLETEHQTGLAQLESKLQDEHDVELASKQAAYLSEVSALQARLDASLTGQAEAERSLAVLRQEKVKTDRRSLESKASADDQLATLQRENEDLSRQLVLVQTSLRDLQRRSGSGTNTRTGTPTREGGHGELASLKLQLDNLEEERLAMRRTLEKRSIEKLELVRQNDFLVKELEVLLAQRSRAKKAVVPMADAVVQTDTFISEPKVDLASVQVLKAQARAVSRPTTPLSPGQRQAKDEIEMAWTTRSFEDYLDNARAELSQLGSVISANEGLFARKIAEHVGELQKAKDQLAADYDARIRGLSVDKQKMEAMVITKQQAAFAKDRKELVASYGADSSDSNASSDIAGRKAVALRTAEERLVADYNRRIFRRKSQIALKHAEEFQNLTREYDRKVADLLDNKSRIEGDLSIDPTKFERDLDNLRTRTARLADRPGSSERCQMVRASVSPLAADDALIPRPLRRRSPTSPAEEDRSRRLTRTSTPRTSLSIPRSTSVPRVTVTGDKNGSQGASQPRRGSEKHPPVPQLSLMRVKTPSDVYSVQPRTVSSPPPVSTPISPKLRRTSQQISPQPPPRLSSRGRGTADLSIEPAQFERQQYQRQSSYIKGGMMPVSMLEPSKPGFLRRVVDRISSDNSRPGSSSSKTMATTSSSAPSSFSKLGHRARSKSTKLSSGMIYYQAPKQSPPA